MAKLKLGPILDEKPVRVNAELAASVHRDLLAYSDALARDTGQAIEPAQLIGPMIARFMATDRAFARARRARGQTQQEVIGASAPAPARESKSA